MSILKGILHHWNKTTKSYDTIHPETEVAQVTDWNEGIVATMASTALSGLVKTLSSDSLLTLLIKKVFEATGVKYSLGQNGYMCWGSLFGGVITQWINNCNFNKESTWPVSFGTIYIAICVVKGYTTDKSIYTCKMAATDGTKFTVTATRDGVYATDIYGFCFGIGKA